MVTGAMVSARPVVSGRGAVTIGSRRSPTATRPARSRFADLLALGAALVAGVLVFRGALPYFFAQDDFAGLARSAGLLPRLASPWRYLSGQVYFDAMRAIAGLSPFPYHLASLIAHLGCVALLFVFLSRRFGTAAAWVGATFFATHPALFTAVYSISGIGEILALLFGLAALLVAEGNESRRSLTVPFFALSLLCKESMVLLPFAVWLLSPGARRGASMVAALMVVSLLYLGVFLAGDVFGLRTALPADAAYSIGFGAHWLWNLLSYLGWTVNIAIFTVRGFTDAIDPRVYPWGIAALALWIAGAFSRTLRARGWIRGGMLYLLFLLPVLALKNHTYHYYLYAPLIGASYCLAALFTAAVSGATGRRVLGAIPSALLALVLAAVLTVNGGSLVKKIETYPFTIPELRADPTVDRARIASNVRDGLADANLPPGTRLRFFSPVSMAIAGAQDSLRGQEGSESYWEHNVRSALMDGLAVRVLFPNVESVEFVRAFSRDDPGARWAVYRPDGDLRVATTRELDSLLTAHRRPHSRG